MSEFPADTTTSKPARCHCSRPASSPEHELQKDVAVCRKFYYDRALSANPTVLPSLLSRVGADHVTQASDWPFARDAAVNLFNRELERYPLNDKQRCALNRGTAETLVPPLVAWDEKCASIWKSTQPG